MSSNTEIKINAENVNVFYGEKQAIKNVSIHVEKSKITALIIDGAHRQFIFSND